MYMLRSITGSFDPFDKLEPMENRYQCPTSLLESSFS
jgi:hypothetical protein